MLSGDSSGAFLQCLSSEKSVLQPDPSGTFVPAAEGNLRFCHSDPNNGFLMSSLHHDPSVLEYLSPLAPPLPPPLQLPQPPSSCLSSNSSTTSDEAEEQQLRAIDERKRRRMISNRESARRSRMRKQRHLDELWSHVVRLWAEKHRLMDRLNQFTECHDRALQENAHLKEEVSSLRQMLRDARINTPDGNTATYASALGDSEAGAALDNILSKY